MKNLGYLQVKQKALGRGPEESPQVISPWSDMYIVLPPTQTFPSPFSPLDPCNRHLWEAGMDIRGRETLCAFTFLYIYAAALAGACGLSFEDWCYPERKIHFNSRGVAVKADLDLFLDWDFPVWAPNLF